MLVISVMLSIVFCGGMIPVTGRLVLDQLSWAIPARWGFAASASTTDLRTIAPLLQTNDTLWSHHAGWWLLDMTALIARGSRPGRLRPLAHPAQRGSTNSRSHPVVSAPHAAGRVATRRCPQQTTSGPQSIARDAAAPPPPSCCGRCHPSTRGSGTSHQSVRPAGPARRGNPVKRAHLARVVSKYTLPVKITILDDLPKNAVRKIARMRGWETLRRGGYRSSSSLETIALRLLSRCSRTDSSAASGLWSRIACRMARCSTALAEIRDGVPEA